MEDLSWIKLVLAFLAGGWELVMRLIPTAKDWTVIGNIFAFLKWVSDYFNNLKKK